MSSCYWQSTERQEAKSTQSRKHSSAPALVSEGRLPPRQVRIPQRNVQFQSRGKEILSRPRTLIVPKGKKWRHKRWKRRSQKDKEPDHVGFYGQVGENSGTGIAATPDLWRSGSLQCAFLGEQCSFSTKSQLIWDGIKRHRTRWRRLQASCHMWTSGSPNSGFPPMWKGTHYL